MKIRVSLDVSEFQHRRTFTLEDLGVTQKEWDETDESGRQELIEKAVDEDVNPPYWVINTFDIID